MPRRWLIAVALLAVPAAARSDPAAGVGSERQRASWDLDDDLQEAFQEGGENRDADVDDAGVEQQQADRLPVDDEDGDDVRSDDEEAIASSALQLSEEQLPRARLHDQPHPRRVAKHHRARRAKASASPLAVPHAADDDDDDDQDEHDGLNRDKVPAASFLEESADADDAPQERADTAQVEVESDGDLEDFSARRAEESARRAGVEGEGRKKSLLEVAHQLDRQMLMAQRMSMQALETAVEREEKRREEGLRARDVETTAAGRLSRYLPVPMPARTLPLVFRIVGCFCCLALLTVALCGKQGIWWTGALPHFMQQQQQQDPRRTSTSPLQVLGRSLVGGSTSPS